MYMYIILINFIKLKNLGNMLFITNEANSRSVSCKKLSHSHILSFMLMTHCLNLMTTKYTKQLFKISFSLILLCMLLKIFFVGT